MTYQNNWDRTRFQPSANDVQDRSLGKYNYASHQLFSVSCTIFLHPPTLSSFDFSFIVASIPKEKNISFSFCSSIRFCSTVLPMADIPSATILIRATLNSHSFGNNTVTDEDNTSNISRNRNKRSHTTPHWLFKYDIYCFTNSSQNISIEAYQTSVSVWLGDQACFVNFAKECLFLCSQSNTDIIFVLMVICP